MNVPRTRRSRFSDDTVSPHPPTGGVHRPSAKLGGHTSVLLHEALENLSLRPDDVVLDATLGGAGHARAICDSLDERGTFIGFDLDEDAIKRAEYALARVRPKTVLVQANFRRVVDELGSRGITSITKALFDLGWSSYQLDSGRGFSLHADEPLLMTYAKEGGAVNARVIVNEWGEGTLADIIYGFGGERYARRIAKRIVERRSRKSIETARELAEIVAEAVPAGYRRGRIHPATKTFQALRIAVNDELAALEEGVRGAFDLLAGGGLIAVITFHSLEDRAVKRLFAELEKEGKGARVTKKPIVPSAEEVQENRRARSAKLRVFRKNDQKTSQNKQVQALAPAGQI